MKKVILKFSGCKTNADLHNVLKDGFGFPDYYGANADALYDCLGELGNEKITIKIFGFNSLSQEVKTHAFGILKVIGDLHHEKPNIKYKIIS